MRISRRMATPHFPMMDVQRLLEKTRRFGLGRG
jgi:hypothetical protein